MQSRVRRAPCPHFPRCVGCPWIGVPYREQLARKQQRLRDAFAARASLAGAEILPIRRAPSPFGYRTVVKLVARRVRGDLRLGVYVPGSHRVADVRRCAAQHPLANALLARLAAVLERERVPCYDERSHEGWLRYVAVRVSGAGRTQLVLVATEPDPARTRALVAALRDVRGLAGVLLNVNADPGNAIFGPRFERLAGDETLVERVAGLSLRSHAGSFAQANAAAARGAYACVLRFAKPVENERALDLYCGVGALSLALAREGLRVLGVEESPAAVRDARANAEQGGLPAARFEAADAGEALRRLAREGTHVDLVALNPPRRGAAADVREGIAALSPSRIVYMSCDPDTLARDLDDFAARGYATRRVQPFDFLPHTEHVEAVALLQAAPPRREA